jgi:hypothetical protein
MRKLTALLATLAFLLAMAIAQAASAATLNVSIGGLLQSVPARPAAIWTDRSAYRVGDRVRISFQSPVGGYAAIYDYSPGGASKMIWPRNGQATGIVPNHTYNLPDGHYDFTAVEPLGTESLVLVVSQARSALTVNFNVHLLLGPNVRANVSARGLTTDPGGAVSEVVTNAQTSFQVLPRWQRPVRHDQWRRRSDGRR